MILLERIPFILFFSSEYDKIMAGALKKHEKTLDNLALNNFKQLRKENKIQLPRGNWNLCGRLFGQNRPSLRESGEHT